MGICSNRGHPSQTLCKGQAYSLEVPAHPARYYGGGDLQFITAGCYHRQPFLGTAQSRDLFLRVLEQMRRRYRFAVLGYVVMPEHFHLLVSEPQRMTLSTVMQALKLGFSRRLLSPGCGLRQPGLWAAPRRLWQARFYDFNVWTERKRIEKLRYMHRNPVKGGLVESPEQWRWSSFRFYLYGEPGPVKLNDTDVLLMSVRERTA
jgi:putative transposase